MFTLALRCILAGALVLAVRLPAQVFEVGDDGTIRDAPGLGPSKVAPPGPDEGQPSPPTPDLSDKCPRRVGGAARGLSEPSIAGRRLATYQRAPRRSACRLFNGNGRSAGRRTSAHPPLGHGTGRPAGGATVVRAAACAGHRLLRTQGRTSRGVSEAVGDRRVEPDERSPSSPEQPTGQQANHSGGRPEAVPPHAATGRDTAMSRMGRCSSAAKSPSAIEAFQAKS